MTLTLLTPTGDRPAAFALCERWMSRQSVRWDQWIVLDDGETPTECTMGQEYVYCPQLAGRGSLAAKIRLAIDSGVVGGDVLAVVEDDDYYRHDYLALALARLDGAEIAGEGRAVYYHVGQRCWYRHANMTHASLCQTVLRRSAIAALRKVAESAGPFLDVPLWAEFLPERRCIMDPGDSPTLVGIKGMPGRAGYGMGHTPSHYTPDPDLTKLYGWIGKDAGEYAGFAA